MNFCLLPGFMNMWQMNLNFGWLRLFFGYLGNESIFIHLLCQKIPVQVVGVEDGDLFGVFHGSFLPVWVGGGQPMASCRAK